MKPTLTSRRGRYSTLIFCLVALYSVLTTAQEDCIKACTKSSGINQCVGDTPHSDAEWNALDPSTQSCYCVSAVNFAGCSPSCSTSGFTADAFGRVFGQWRYVDTVCVSEVAEYTATASISTNTGYSTTYPTVVPNPNTTTVLSHVTVSPEPTANSTTLITSTTSEPTTTSTTTDSAVPLGASESPTPSSTNTRTVAISVSLACAGTLAVAGGLWLLFRNRRRKQLTQNLYETRDAMVIVVDSDGRPLDPDAPNYPPYPPQMRADPQSETVKRWIEDQEEANERDAMTETLSVGYTLWTDTDLCVTEMGAEDSRDMATIMEDPDAEDTIRRSL